MLVAATCRSLDSRYHRPSAGIVQLYQCRLTNGRNPSAIWEAYGKLGTASFTFRLRICPAAGKDAGHGQQGVARRSNRSKVTNGRSLFAAGGDNRSPWARRMRDVFETHLLQLWER